MATFNPQYVNLNPYEALQLQRRANTVSPIDAALQSLQQGIQLQQLPQQLQDQALQRELNNALLREKLISVQNPNQALARELQKIAITEAVRNPQSGIIQTPAGAIGETIATPQAIPQTAVQLDQALAANPAMAIPNSAPTLPIVPLGTGNVQTGLSQDLNVPAQAVEDKLNRDINLINARASASGSPIRYERGLNNEIIALPGRQFGTTAPQATPVLSTATGEVQQLQPKPVAGSRAGGGRALTPNAQTTLLSKASAAGIDPDSPKYFDKETNTYDFVKLAIDQGKASRENKRQEDAAKAAAAKGRTKTDIDALNAAEKQLDFLQDEVTEIARSGNLPGFLDNIIAAETSAPPSGWLSAGWQQLLKDVQSEESKELEGKKAIVSSALTKAISGLAVTNSEAQRLGFLPRPGESFEEIVRKAAVLKEYIKNQRDGLAGVPAPEATAPAASPASTGQQIGRFKLIDVQ